MDSLFDATEYEAQPLFAVEPLPPIPEPVGDEAPVAEGDSVAQVVVVESVKAITDSLVSDPVEPDPISETADVVVDEPVTEPPPPEFDETTLREPSNDALWLGVVGQDAALTQLRSSTLTPTHAYLFVGAAGVGKLAAARAFGAALLCPRGGCARCSVCVRAQVQAHPDLIVVEREGASISVDQAREIIRLALRSPTVGDRKVLVLVDFHLVTNAAPTLLKIIEEPPPSTVFVILAEQITPELVTIASRCVQVPFAVLSRGAVIDALVAEGAAPDDAMRAADVAGGRLDRARLLVGDPSLGDRLVFWQQIPRRLDGTGAAVSVIAAETLTLLDSAATAPLEARQAAEAKALDERLEASGVRGGAGARKELAERHKREQKRVRDDELRFGLGVLGKHYAHVAAADPSTARSAVLAVDALGAANEHLERNPNLSLLLQSLLLKLPRG
jgi:DNA polymerase III subunit delta'